MTVKVKCGRCETVNEFDSGFCTHCGFYIKPASNHTAEDGTVALPDLADPTGLAKHFYDTYWNIDSTGAGEKVIWEDLNHDEREKFTETMRQVVCDRVISERERFSSEKDELTFPALDIDLPVIEHLSGVPMKRQRCYGCGTRDPAPDSQLCYFCRGDTS